jgi:hypothetical protein
MNILDVLKLSIAYAHHMKYMVDQSITSQQRTVLKERYLEALDDLLSLYDAAKIDPDVDKEELKLIRAQFPD